MRSALALFVLVSVFASVAVYAQAVPAERLVWSDEFSGPGVVPNPANWTYEVGGDGWGNHELEFYCAPTATTTPCDASQPNAAVRSDGYLHISARRNAAGQWTSARMITRGLQSFQYGRIEARIKIPAGEGVWPAFWALSDNGQWPAGGELDVMENIGREPMIVHGSIHGTGFTGEPLGTAFKLTPPANFAADFHTYGLIWSPGKIQYYVDDPAHPYATYTPADLPAGAVWPFDATRFYLLLNLAIGGGWPGPPNAATPSPSEMLVDYVRVYQRVETVSQLGFDGVPAGGVRLASIGSLALASRATFHLPLTFFQKVR
jgi:beta-glucanase (GH16 family)